MVLLWPGMVRATLDHTKSYLFLFRIQRRHCSCNISVFSISSHWRHGTLFESSCNFTFVTSPIGTALRLFCTMQL